MQAKTQDNMTNLEEIRKKLDIIDEKIGKLLEDRVEKVIEIKKIKESKKLPIINHQREKEILDKMDTQYKKNIFKKILSESRKLQKKRK